MQFIKQNAKPKVLRSISTHMHMLTHTHTHTHKALWLTLLILFVMFGTGCKKAIVWYYGIRGPMLESEQSLDAYLSELGLENEQYYVFRDTNDLIAFFEQVHSFPDAFFFNAQKQYVPYKANPADCNAKVVDFSKDMASIDEKPTDTAFQFSFFQEKMSRLPGLQPADSMDMSGKDAYVFLLWATYYGKLNKTKVLDWVEHIHTAQKSGVNVGYYLINCDYIKEWGINEEQLPEYELKE